MTEDTERISSLESTISNILNLAASAQSGNALPLCQRIAAICTQALQRPCTPDCEEVHSISRLARIEDVTPQSIYKLKATKGLNTDNGLVNHAEYRRLRQRESRLLSVE